MKILRLLLLEISFLCSLEGTKPSTIPVVITLRSHLFPFRTQKLSSMVPKILSWRRLGKIGCCRILYSSIAQSVEHAAVNRRVVSSSLTGGAKQSHCNCNGFFVVPILSLHDAIMKIKNERYAFAEGHR